MCSLKFGMLLGIFTCSGSLLHQAFQWCCRSAGSSSSHFNYLSQASQKIVFSCKLTGDVSPGGSYTAARLLSAFLFIGSSSFLRGRLQILSLILLQGNPSSLVSLPLTFSSCLAKLVSSCPWLVHSDNSSNGSLECHLCSLKSTDSNIFTAVFLRSCTLFLVDPLRRISSTLRLRLICPTSRG